MFKYFLYLFGKWIINILPLRLSYKGADFFCYLHYKYSRIDREAVSNNLKIILPEKSEAEIDRLTQRVFRNFGYYLIEFFWMGKKIDHTFIEKRVKIKNIHYISQALRKGKGCIVLTAHLGNWELGGVILSFLGYTLSVIALPHKERPVNDLFNAQREVKGARVIPNTTAVRHCIAALLRNECVALVGDRDYKEKEKEEVHLTPFFGIMTPIPKGAAIFAAKTGASMVPVFLIRNEDLTFTLDIGQPISPGVSNGHHDQELINDLLEKHVGVIENKIREYPDQWLMFREIKRGWKSALSSPPLTKPEPSVPSLNP